MRIGAIILRIIRQFFHDKRSLALLFIAPLLILTLMSLVFHGETYTPKLGIVDVSGALTEVLQAQGAKLESFDSLAAGEQAVRDRQIDALIRLEGSNPVILLEGSDPSVSQMIKMIMQGAVQSMNSPSAGELDISYMYGTPEMSSFDNFGPALVGIFAFFFVFLLSGISFLRERTGGTLERLLAAPIRRYEIVGGYLLGFGLFAVLQSILITWFSIEILDMMMAGSFWLVLVVTLILALNALTLGTLLSAYARTEFQVVQFIPLVIVPQIFFSGLFNLDTVVEWLRPIHLVMPLYYGVDALQGIMVRGENWTEIAFNVYVLLAISIIFAAVNVLVLRKYRRL